MRPHCISINNIFRISVKFSFKVSVELFCRSLSEYIYISNSNLQLYGFVFLLIFLLALKLNLNVAVMML